MFVIARSDSDVAISRKRKRLPRRLTAGNYCGQAGCRVCAVSRFYRRGDFSAVRHRGRVGWRGYAACSFYRGGFLDFARNDSGDTGVRLGLKRINVIKRHTRVYSLSLRGNEVAVAISRKRKRKLRRLTAGNYCGQAGCRVCVVSRFYRRGFLG